MNEGKMIPQNDQVRRFEVVKRFLETKNEEAVLRCLETMEQKKSSIGVGRNAEVFAVENEPLFQKLCVKEIKKLPKVKMNDIDQEFDFQEAVNALGVKTPRNIMVVRNLENRKEYIIMEKIDGYSIGDLTDNMNSRAIITDNYNHDQFFRKLEDMVKKMHDHRIYHRDLHSGNVMVDSMGQPVIIDFGSADYGYGQEEDIYLGSGFVLEKVEKVDGVEAGKYVYGSSMLPNDDQQVKNLEAQMRRYKK